MLISTLTGALWLMHGLASAMSASYYIEVWEFFLFFISYHNFFFYDYANPYALTSLNIIQITGRKET